MTRTTGERLAQLASRLDDDGLAPIGAAATQFNGHVDVREFGAVGDGVTDDTAAIQAAIDHAYSLGTGSGKTNQPIVYLPSGNFRITASLTMRDYASMKGAGREATKITSEIVGGSAIRPVYGEFPAYGERTVVWNLSDFSLLNSTTIGGSGVYLKLAQGGSSTTITLNAAESAVDDFYVGWFVKIEGGPGVGLQGTITAYNGTTKVATISGTFGTPPTAASRYRLEANTIGLNMGSVGYSNISNMDILGYTFCMRTYYNGYYNTWNTVKTNGYIAMWLNSDGGANTMTACEVNYYYQGVRVDQGDFVQSGGSVESLIFDTDAGTAQAGAASTITLAAGASAEDQRWTGFRITIEGGTAAGQVAVISDYNGTTKVATVTPAWGVVPDATSTYHIGSDLEHHSNYVGFGGGAPAALKSVGVYYETYTRSSVLGLYGPTMQQCTLMSPSKRGYASTLTLSVPSQFMTDAFLGVYTPFVPLQEVQFADGLQGTIRAYLRSTGGNQIDAIAADGSSYGAVAAASFYPAGDSATRWTTGAGSPEGVVTASPGAMYLSSSGGASTTLYIKESGSGNTGWVAK